MDSIPSPHSFIFSDEYICQWDSCLKNFDDAERLYEHLGDHVGRKALHNLCLTCRWDKCTVPTFAKRDHIISHLRVHVASKPYHCEICRKGFKRPQDLKKHEKTHQENADDQSIDAPATSTSSFGHLQPSRVHAFPLTPPTALDRSPSVASAVTGSSLSPYSFPLSPADTAESWNPGLSSPSYSTNSDLFSSPSAPDLELDLMSSFDRPNIDVSGAYYGVFPNANGYDDMISPMSSKRSRDGFDEVLSETLGAFAVEAKKKRTDASYNEDMMGRLNALSVILEVNPMTPDRLLSSLPEVTDWNQFNQFNQFCSTLFEDVSGEAFEPQTFDLPLFPEYEQKQTPIALDAKYGGIDGFQNYNNAAAGLDNGNMASYGMGVDSIYSTVIPDDPFVPPTASTTLPFGSSDMQWNPSFTQPGPGVTKSQIAKSSVHQPSRFSNPQYVSLPALQQGAMRVKVEPEEPVLEHKVVVKEERMFADMSTQTKENQKRLAATADGMMMKQRPSAATRKNKSREPIDADALLESAPDVPDTPLLDIRVGEADTAEDTARPEQEQEVVHADEPQAEEADATVTASTSEASTSKFGNYAQKARAKLAAAAAAAAAAEASEHMDPIEVMTRQLAQTRLDGSDSKNILKPSTTKPITEGDMERQIKAAKARSLCSQDPVRKQHADVILNLLKNIDTLMTEHRERVAHYKAVQTKGAAYPRTVSGVHVQNQGQIRTVSSYLPHRGASSSTTQHRPSPLQQEHGVDSKAVPHYSQLRSNLTEGSSYSSPAALRSSSSLNNGDMHHRDDEISTDSPVLYPTSDLHNSSIVPFELSEEERRFIEEDNAKIAAAQAAAVATEYHITHV